MKASTAHGILNRAVAAGKVTRPDACSACNRAGRVHGHHADYSKPLDVTWLCPRCHRKAHATGGPVWTGRDPELQVRVPVALREDTDQAIRQLAAAGRRPVSWEIRQALEEYVAANAHQLKEAA